MTAASLMAEATQVQTASVVLFYLFAALTAAASLGVVCSRNIVRTAVWLLFALIGVAGLFFLLEAEFLAAVQLVIYAGGTLILIIFGVMLTSKSPFSRFEPKAGEVAIAVTVSAVLFAALVMAIRAANFQPKWLETREAYPVGALGQALLGDYLVPFELASVVLLVVMIGAAYLARSRRRESPPSEQPGQKPTLVLSKKARDWS